MVGSDPATFELHSGSAQLPENALLDIAHVEPFQNKMLGMALPVKGSKTKQLY